MGSRNWLRILLWALAIIACGAQILAMVIGAPELGQLCVGIASVILPGIILANEGLARWRRGNRHIVGSWALTGITVPTVLLGVDLTFVAFAATAYPNPAGVGIFSYVAMPFCWPIAVFVGGTLGAIMDAILTRRVTQ